MIANLSWTLGQSERVVRFELPPEAGAAVDFDAPHVVIPVEPRPAVRILGDRPAPGKPGRRKGARMPVKPGSTWAQIVSALQRAGKSLSLAEIVQATGGEYTLVSVTLCYRAKKGDVIRIGHLRDYHYRLPEVA